MLFSISLKKDVLMAEEYPEDRLAILPEMLMV